MPTLAKFYHQASESYEQSCTRQISVVIYYVSNIFTSLQYILFLVESLLSVSLMYVNDDADLSMFAAI